MVVVPAFYEFRNLNPLILRATMKKSRKLGGIGNAKTRIGRPLLCYESRTTVENSGKQLMRRTNGCASNLMRGTIGPECGNDRLQR